MATSLPPLKEIEPLSPLVTRILGGNPSKFTLQGTNTYLIGTGPSRILIDSAQGFPAWHSILSQHLSTHSLTIHTILITHNHPDHTLGLGDALTLCPSAQIYKFPAPPSDPPYPCPPAHITSRYQPISDGQRFSTPGATLRAVYSPGHTSDHVCFLLEEEGALFTGDNVLGHGTAVFEDLAVYLASLEKMRALDGFTGRAYPGHGEVIADGVEKCAEYVRHRRRREEEVLGVLGGEGEAVDEGLTAGEVVKVVYKDVPVALHGPAEGGVVQVLRKLEGEGKVTKGTLGRWTVVGKAVL